MKILKIATLVLGLLPAVACAEVLDLKYGANVVDINNDGVMDLITRIRWNTLTAHSFDEYTVAIKDQQIPEDAGTFYSVPLEQGYEHMHFSTLEAAGCEEGEPNMLVAYKFELNKNSWLEVTKYSIPLGETWGDKQVATIAKYQLTDVVEENADEPEVKWVPGDARFYLKKIKETVTKKKHCNVQVLMK